MEQVHHRTGRFTKRSNVVAIEEAKTSKTNVEEPVTDGDDLLKCFSPLINNMRLFGLYFTRQSCIHDASRSTTVTPDPTAASRKWNGGRIYAIVIMAVLWLDTVRMFSVFEKTDKFGFVLLLKLALVSARLLSAVLQTACFVACQTGNLDRVFRDARLPKSDHIRYRRLAVIHATVWWILIVVEMLIFLVPMFLTEQYWDISLTPFGIHVVVSDTILLIIRLFSSLLYFFSYAAWGFSQSVNYRYRLYSKVLQCTTV